MKTFRRANCEITVEDTAEDAMIAQGYEEINPKTGAVTNPKLSEVEKLKKENKKLKEENKALREQLEAANLPTV